MNRRFEGADLAALNIPWSGEVPGGWGQIQFWNDRGDSYVDIGLRIYAETIDIDRPWVSDFTKFIYPEIKAALDGCNSARYFLKKFQELHKKTIRPFCSFCGYECQHTARCKSPVLRCEHCGNSHCENYKCP